MIALVSLGQSSNIFERFNGCNS